MSNPNQPSTLQAAIDSVSGTIQSAVGSLTGNTADKREAEYKKQHADAEHDLSQAGAHVGPVSMSTTGQATIDNKDRRDGQWNETVGSIKQAAGNIIGSQDLKDAGRRQEQEGQGQKAAGQVKDYTTGTVDRAVGAVGSGIASLAGNRDAESDFQRQHDKGKTTVRGLEAEINK